MQLSPWIPCTIFAWRSPIETIRRTKRADFCTYSIYIYMFSCNSLYIYVFSRNSGPIRTAPTHPSGTNYFEKTYLELELTLLLGTSVDTTFSTKGVTVRKPSPVRPARVVEGWRGDQEQCQYRFPIATTARSVPFPRPAFSNVQCEHFPLCT